MQRLRRRLRRDLCGASAEDVVEGVVPEAHPVLRGLDETEGVELGREQGRLAEREPRVLEGAAEPVSRGVDEVPGNVEVEPPSRGSRASGLPKLGAPTRRTPPGRRSRRSLEREGGRGHMLEDVPMRHRVEVPAGPAGLSRGPTRTGMSRTSRAWAEDRSSSSVPCTSQPAGGRRRGGILDRSRRRGRVRDRPPAARPARAMPVEPALQRLHDGGEASRGRGP